MREIRMAEASGRPNRVLCLLAQLYAAIQKWLHHARKPAPRFLPQPSLHAKQHARK
jgi:hypothetical protein